MLKHVDGRIDEYVRHNDLWVLLTTIACATMNDKEIEEHENMGHTTHNAKCKWCMMGRQRVRAHGKVKEPTQKLDGVTMYLDLMGEFEEDIRKCVYEMVCMEGTYGWMEIMGLKDKSSKSTKEGYEEMRRHILVGTGQQHKEVVRFHTDDGSEFKGEFEDMIRVQNSKHTHTGGYNSISNPAENALARVQQSARAMLVQATGGEEYYKLLRGPALQRAAYCMNRRSDSEKHSPHRKAWGEEFVWCTQEHPFGARALFHIVKAKRGHTQEY